MRMFEHIYVHAHHDARRIAVMFERKSLRMHRMVGKIQRLERKRAVGQRY
jgi:hypothetical protein